MNLIIVDLSNLVIRIRDKEVCFKAERINVFYRLKNVDMRDYEAKDYAPGR